MKAVVSILLVTLVSFPALAWADRDHAEIAAVVQKYFDGTSQGKPALVRDAFLPSLEVQWLGDKAELKRRPGPDYIARITPGKKVPRTGRIVSIDVSGNAAAVKAEIRWNDRLYTDYMLLLKVGGRWRISNKIATWRTVAD